MGARTFEDVEVWKKAHAWVLAAYRFTDQFPGSQPWRRHAEDDDFVQAGNLYRLMIEEEKRRLIANLAAGLAHVSRPDVVERSISYFRNADADYGERLAQAVYNLRGAKG